jgi:hypothetical protein
MEKHMRIWKLTPIDPTDLSWKGYDTKPMFVRAETAKQAQDLAQYATFRLGVPIPGQKIEFNPWVGYKTQCEDVTDNTGYSIDGAAEVLGKI